MSSQVMDLDQIFEDWAWYQYSKTSWWFSRISNEHLLFDVNWERVRVKSKEPEYCKSESEGTRSKVVYESLYENSTDKDQTNNFRTEQETTSTAAIMLTQGFSRSADVNIELPLPPDRYLRESAKAVGSFGTCFSIGSTEESKVEKNMKWSADSAVVSERQKMTVVKLEVQFTQESFSFDMNVELKGRIIVSIRDCRVPNKVVRTIEGDVATIILDMQEEGRYDDILGAATVDMRKGVVVWLFSGSIELKYGISQKVNVLTQPLPEHLSTKEIQTEGKKMSTKGIQTEWNSTHISQPQWRGYIKIMTSKVTDPDKVVETWAWQHYITTVWWFSRMNFKHAIFDINWSKVKTYSEKADYSSSDDNTQVQVVYESRYQNSTHKDQTNNFRTEQETTSTAVIKLTKGFIRSLQVGIELLISTDDKLKKATGSFGDSFYIGCEEEFKVEKKLKWSADTTIISESQKVTVAKLEVQESLKTFTFSMGVKVKGTIIINIRDRRDPSKVVKTIEGDVAIIISDMQDDRKCDSLVGAATVDLQHSSVKWPFGGTLMLKYGVSQTVNILSEPLPIPVVPAPGSMYPSLNNHGNQ